MNTLHVYLSGTPHRLRLEALRIYGRDARPEASLPRIRLIEAGDQDARFAPLATELRAARLQRQTELAGVDQG